MGSVDASKDIRDWIALLSRYNTYPLPMVLNEQIQKDLEYYSLNDRIYSLNDQRIRLLPFSILEAVGVKYLYGDVFNTFQ